MTLFLSLKKLELHGTGSTVDRATHYAKRGKSQSDMNLLEIKERLAQFVRTFARNDVQLLVQFMELTVMEYKRNPVTFFELMHFAPTPPSSDQHHQTRNGGNHTQNATLEQSKQPEVLKSQPAIFEKCPICHTRELIRCYSEVGGVRSCLSCMKFFTKMRARRSTSVQGCGQRHTKADIKKCKKCRYRRCLDMGMSSVLVQQSSNPVNIKKEHVSDTETRNERHKRSTRLQHQAATIAHFGAHNVVRSSFAGAKCQVCQSQNSVHRRSCGSLICQACTVFFTCTKIRLRSQNKKELVCLSNNNCNLYHRRRKECPACRFARCLKVGLKLTPDWTIKTEKIEAGAENEAVGSTAWASNELPLSHCRVCHSNKDVRVRYGSLVCEACASFFNKRRNESGESRRCPNKGACDLYQNNRTRCIRCRMQKCLEIGMSYQAAPRAPDEHDYDNFRQSDQSDAESDEDNNDNNNNNNDIEKADDSDYDYVPLHSSASQRKKHKESVNNQSPPAADSTKQPDAGACAGAGDADGGSNVATRGKRRQCQVCWSPGTEQCKVWRVRGSNARLCRECLIFYKRLKNELAAESKKSADNAPQSLICARGGECDLIRLSCGSCRYNKCERLLTATRTPKQ